MKKQILTSAFTWLLCHSLHKKSASIKIYADQGKEIIPKEIYGQFGRTSGIMHLWRTMGR